ncbi:metallophosphoesterase [Pasteurellaceae bacterium 22721_9_1]
MEFRYYVIFTVVALSLQLLLWIFHRTLRWLFADKWQKNGGWILSALIVVGANTIVLLTVFRIYPQFRLSAGLLVFLLYAAYSSAIVWFIQFILKKYGKNSVKLHRSLRIFYPFLLSTFFGLSLYNAYVPQVIHYQIQLDKPTTPFRIGMASDFHLGKFFGASQLDRLAHIFEQQKVDVILLPGDIMDDNVNAYLAEKMQPHLAKLKAPLGVYATLGNHDLFGDEVRIENEIRRAGIIPLDNKVQNIANRFILIGRNDDLDRNRPTTEVLLQQVNSDLPVILLDHRPTDIEQHAKLPIDIQVSGHTHKGQIFPANLITKLTYFFDYGYKKIGNGHFFVTSGYGFWGVPFRLGSQSEVVIIDVK